MKLTTKQIARALYDALKDSAPAARQQVIENFVRLLHELHSMSKAEKIIADFVACYNEAEGIEEVTVETASPLSATEQAEIIEQLASALNKKIELTQLVSPLLIGGLRLRYGDTAIDGSIEARLRQLRQVASADVFPAV